MKTVLDFNYPVALTDEDDRESFRIQDGYGGMVHVTKCRRCENPAQRGSIYCPDHETSVAHTIGSAPAAASREPLQHETLYASAFTDPKDRVLFETFLQSKGNLEAEIALLKVEAVKVVQADSAEFKGTRQRIQALTQIIETMRRLIMTHHDLFEKLEVSVLIDLEMVGRISGKLSEAMDRMSNIIADNVPGDKRDKVADEIMDVKQWLAGELRRLT